MMESRRSVAKGIVKGAVDFAVAQTSKPGAHLSNASQVENWAHNQWFNQASAQQEFGRNGRDKFVAAVVEEWKRRNNKGLKTKSAPEGPYRNEAGWSSGDWYIVSDVKGGQTVYVWVKNGQQRSEGIPFQSIREARAYARDNGFKLKS